MIGSDHKVFKAYSDSLTGEGCMAVMYAGTGFKEEKVIEHILDKYPQAALIVCNREVIWVKGRGVSLARKLKFKTRKNVR